MMASARRRRTGAQRGADAVLSYVIPFVFIVIAGYQQVAQGKIDKYVIGVLLIFGLGALGWRLDVLFETYMRAKYSVPDSRRAANDDDEDDENGGRQLHG
jgi:hypothetical protein